jgi:hypothetical protein
MKRLIACLLALALLATLVPAGVLAADTVLELSNTYLKYSLNTATGAFQIGTLEGHPQKEKDNHMPLLFDGGLQTSYTTVRIDGEDYVFGKSYGFLGLDSQLSEPVLNQGDQTLSVTWSIKGIEITQLAELKSDPANPLSGNVGLRYTVKNNSGTAAEVGVRVLLDNALGDNDAPFVMAEGNTLPTFYETELANPAPSQIRFMDSYTNSNVMSYAILNSWSGAVTPDRAVVGHWYNLADTRWDFTPDGGLRFTESTSRLGTADAASAYYFDPRGYENGSQQTLELMYGVGDFSAQSIENGPNVTMSFDRQPTLNETGDGYADDGVFTLSVKIDNTIDDAQTHTNSTIYLSFEENLEVVKAPSDASDYTVGIGIINPGDILTYEWTFRAKPQDYYISSAFVASLSTSLTSLLYREYVLLPSVKGNLPDFTIDTVAPTEVYHQGTKMITLKGSYSVPTLKGTAGTQWGVYLENVNTGDAYHCLGKDLTFIGKNFDTLAIQYRDDLPLGTYRIVINFTGGLADLFGGGTGKIIPDQTILVSDNKALVSKTYGVLTVMRQGTSYHILPFETEEDFADYVEQNGLRKKDCAQQEIMLELRGAVKEYDDGTEHYFYADPIEDDIILNNILRYGNTDSPLMLTEFEIDDTSGIRVAGDGDLGVVGGMTFFKWGFELEFENGYVYTHDSEKVGDAYSEFLLRDIRIDYTGGAGLLQNIAGFLFQLNYGVLTEDWSSLDGESEPEESKGYAIDFGGKIAITFFEKPDLPGSGDEDDNFGYKPVPTAPDTTEYVPADGDDSSFSLAGLGLSTAIDHIMFGEKTNGTVGFIGIDTTVGVELPEGIFGGLVETGPNMELTIDTIDNVYTISGGVGLKVFECSGLLSIKMMQVGGEDGILFPIADRLEFGMGGMDALRVAPPVLAINSLSGGIENLYDTLSGNFDKGLPPITIKLGVTLDLFEVLRGGGELKLSPRGFSLDTTLGIAKIPAVTLNGLLEAEWADPYYISATGELSLLDMFIGGVTLRIGEGERGGAELRGTVYGTFKMPDVVPVAGGIEFAGAEGYLSTQSVGVSAKYLGDYVGIVYYWGSDGVEFTSGTEPMYGPDFPLDPMTYSTNLKQMSVRTLAMGNSVSGISFTLTEEQKQMSTLYVEIPYTGQTPSAKDVTIAAGTIPVVQAATPADDGNLLIRDGKIVISLHQADLAGLNTVQINVGGGCEINSENYAVYGVAAQARLASGTSVLNGKTIHYTTVTENRKEQSELSLYLTQDKDALEALKNKSPENKLGTPINASPITGNAIAAGTISIPDTLPSGTYYAVYTLSTEGEAGTAYLDEAHPIVWTNDSLPDALTKVSLLPAGDHSFKVNVEGLDPEATDLYVQVKDANGNAIPGYELLRYDAKEKEDIYVGAGKEVTAFTSKGDGNAALVPYTIAPLTEGESYYVTVTPARYEPNIPSENNAEAYRQQRIFYAPPTDSAKVILPQVQTPQLVRLDTPDLQSKNGKNYLQSDSLNARYEFDQEVQLSVSVNGSVYDYADAYQKVWDISLPLADGDYAVTYTARNRSGDTARSSLTASADVCAFTKDTAPPPLYIEGGNRILVSRESPDANSFQISGVSEKGAEISIENSRIAVDGDGKFAASIPFAFDKLQQDYYLTAYDAAGNENTLRVIAVNDEIKGISKIEINSEKTPENKTISVNTGEILQLYAKATDSAGKQIDVTNQVEWTALTNPETADLEDGMFTPLREGTYTIRASLANASYVTGEGDEAVQRKGALEDVLHIVAQSQPDQPDEPDRPSSGGGFRQQTQIQKDLLKLTQSVGSQNILKVIEVYPTRQTSVQATDTITAIVPVESADKEDRIVMHKKIENPHTNALREGDRVLGEQFSFAKLYEGKLKKPLMLQFDCSGMTPEESANVGLYRYNAYFDRWERVLENSRTETAITVPVEPLSGQFAFLMRENEMMFRDVARDSWSAPYIYGLSSLGVIKGYMEEDKMLFKPENPITRAEFLTLVLRTLKVDVSGYVNEQLPFVDRDDIPEWAVDSFKAGYKLGIMKGMQEENGIVSGWEQPIVRMDAFILLYRAKPFELTQAPTEFTDQNEIAEYARDAVQCLAEKGVISGYPDGSMNGTGSITREETAATLKRWIEKVLME